MRSTPYPTRTRRLREVFIRFHGSIKLPLNKSNFISALYNFLLAEQREDYYAALDAYAAEGKLDDALKLVLSCEKETLIDFLDFYREA